MKPWTSGGVGQQLEFNNEVKLCLPPPREIEKGCFCFRFFGLALLVGSQQIALLCLLYLYIYTNAQIYKYTIIHVYKYANTQTHKFANIQIYKYTNKYINI